MNLMNYREVVTHWRVLAGSSVVLALASAGALSMIANASPSPSFGGGDAGVLAPAAGNIASAPSAAASSNGITVKVTGFVADDTRTVVGVAVEGRDNIGDTVFPARPTVLIDQDGKAYYENGGSANQNNRREKTIYFPAMPATVTRLTLVVDSLDFLNHSDTVLAKSGDEVPQVAVNGPWSVSFDLTSPIGQSQEVSVGGGARPLGRDATVTLDSVRQAPTETVIQGHFSGFSLDEMPELLIGAELIGSGAQGPTAFIGLRTGYGPAREQFEVRFPRTAGAVSLRISAAASPQPHDADAASSLSAQLGPSAETSFALNLPG